MKWEFAGDKPIFIQLVEMIELQIINGDFCAGSKLPSIRELSSEAGVNPNTVQKALGEIEQKKLIKTVRTSGKYVTNDEKLINNMKISYATGIVESLYKQLNGIGYAKEEAIILIEYVIENVEKHRKKSIEEELLKTRL